MVTLFAGPRLRKNGDGSSCEGLVTWFFTTQKNIFFGKTMFGRLYQCFVVVLFQSPRVCHSIPRQFPQDPIKSPTCSHFQGVFPIKRHTIPGNPAFEIIQIPLKHIKTTYNPIEIKSHENFMAAPSKEHPMSIPFKGPRQILKFFHSPQKPSKKRTQSNSNPQKIHEIL